MGMNKLRWMKYQAGRIAGRTSVYGEYAALEKAVKEERQPTASKPRKTVQRELF